MSIIINGNSYSGSNIVISNGKILINGNDLTPDSKEINITVDGNIDNLSVDCCNTISVVGEVSRISTQSGDVVVSGDVSGGIKTMSGDVTCSNVSGNIKTMSGDVEYRKS